MVENIKDPLFNDYSTPQPPKVQKPLINDSGIDHKDLKGILFLGVKGNINIEVSGDEGKLDILA